MEAMECLLTRRSVRSYQDRQVPREALEQVLRAGQYAPSAMGRQSAFYIAVQDAWIFDRTFADYAGYKKRTPFLIPGAAQWRSFWNGKVSREGKA